MWKMLAGAFPNWMPAAAPEPEPEPVSPPPRAPRPRARTQRPPPVEAAAAGEAEQLVQPPPLPRRAPEPGALRAAVTGRKPRARKGDALKKCPTARLQKLLAAAS